jgi:hypothetical protein
MSNIRLAQAGCSCGAVTSRGDRCASGGRRPRRRRSAGLRAATWPSRGGRRSVRATREPLSRGSSRRPYDTPTGGKRPVRDDRAAVGQQLAGVVEDNHAVAQQTPALFRVGGDDARSGVVPCVRRRTNRVVVAHVVHLDQGLGESVRKHPAGRGAQVETLTVAASVPAAPVDLDEATADHVGLPSAGPADGRASTSMRRLLTTGNCLSLRHLGWSGLRTLGVDGFLVRCSDRLKAGRWWAPWERVARSRMSPRRGSSSSR